MKEIQLTKGLVTLVDDEDLLAACKALLALPGISSFAADLMSAAVKQAEAVIARAEGR